MKFKRLEVAGFKSFADKLEIKFGQGITGIVGPNGCGKSNVADAVRWVLGEQSAKLLRGSSMQDVIFNGTEQRKSLSFCEVSLCFDNTPDENGEKLFPALEFKEVVISRKLYRSGESVYLLNKQVCRLKDITELLRDGGMGREGYSIIGQGRIDELLSAKPEDRRAIFEEAAGISKHKAKKTESERKLARSNEALLRITDILEEKAKQLEPLTRQSENARKWLSYRDQLRRHEINLYIYQYDTASEAKRVISERLNGVIEELDLRNRESEAANKEANEAFAAIANTDCSIDGLREELLQLTVGMERDAGEMKRLGDRRGYLSEQSVALNEDNAAAEKEHIRTLEMIAAGTAALQELQTRLTEKQKEFEEISAEYVSVAEQIMQGEGEADLHHAEMIAAMDRLTDIKANAERLKAEKEALLQSVEDLKRRIQFLNQKLAVDTDEAEKIKKVTGELILQKEDFSATRDGARTTHNEALAVIHDCASRLDKLTAEYHGKKTRRKMFVEMQESNESLSHSVKKLLSDAKANHNLASKIEGVVAQLIKVAPGFETAVESALGNAVQNIVTNSEEEAKFLIAYLKERRYGQITFLPVSSVKPRGIDSRYSHLLDGDGCFGCALNHITFDPRYDSVMRGLLGGTVFVRDMDAAVALAKQSGYGFKIVTKEGDVIQTSGSITGGSRKSELTNIFGYDREIESLNARIAELEREIADLNKLREEKSQIQLASAKKLTEVSERIHEIDILLAAKNESLTAVTDAAETAAVTIGNLEFDMLNATERIQSIEKDLDSVVELEALVSGERGRASEVREEQRAAFEKMRGNRDRLHELRTQAQVAVASLQNDVKNYGADIARLQENAVSLTNRIENNHVRLSENKIILDEIDASLNVFSAGAKESDSDRVTQIRTTLGNLSEFKQSLQGKMEAIDTRRSSLLEQIQFVHEKKSREEQLLLKVDSDIEYLQARVLEEYELSYNDCLPFKENDYNLNEGAQEVTRLRRLMQGLGNVNLDAIEQCKTVYEEYHALNLQKQDAEKAISDMQRIIAQLSKEMLQLFATHFETIRTNFVKIFKELFNGGTADLILLESADPLEAGIEIVAQPPEKKLQTITLLSGGERALTAIAILFAILRLRPMPFCVLDEIEAALDDANAGRFASYLRRFAQGTQFIVITHRKPTMELADSLYGVTMEEKGVSKIVSVKLSEAVSVAEPA